MHLTASWIRALALLALAAITGALLILAACYLYLAPQLPAAVAIREVEYQIPLRIYTADGKLIAEYGEKRREPITYDEIPPLFVKAVLAAEDERFFEHPGVDPKGLLRAALELVRYQEIRSGGSTITMQVARNFFLDREQRFLRKFNEIVLAIQIERILSKEEILELYLNKIYLGHRAYGAEAAAQVYYGKPIGELTLPQLAMIAGLPKAPSAYNPITNPERARLRRNWILFRMEETGAISQEQMETARQAPVTARYHAASPEVEGAYMGEIARIAAQDLVDKDVYTEGVRIYTTLDSERQNAAVTALRQGLHDYDERHGYRGPLAHIGTDDLPDPGWPRPQDTEAAPDQDQPEPELAKATEPDDSDELDDDRAAWVERFSDQPAYGPLHTAVVTALRERQAAVLLADGNQAVLEWDDLKWARPALNKGYMGEAPNRAGDVLKVGDVIYVRPVGDNQDARWRLAQLPRAQSAIVSLDPDTGAVQALQGGYSFYASKFNRATQARRQVGSAFKPFVYTAALENGFTPATIINDAPVVFDSSELDEAWRPTGASERFYGPTRLREALYRSLNLVSIRILRQVGIGQTMNTLNHFGLPTERFQRDLSLALGSASLTPLELAGAYAIFANGGYRVTPYFLERIEDKNGKVLWKAPRVEKCEAPCAVVDDGDAVAESTPDLDEDGKPIQPPPVKAPRVEDENIIWLMNSILHDVVERGTGRDARRLGRGDLHGKTGTTNDQVDAWFSGFSPALVATVWVGFDSPATLGWGEYGGRAALPIWIDYMGKALDGVEERYPPQPPGIVSVRIDPESGLQARPDNPNAIFEYFREDNVPELESPHSNDGRTPEQIF
ncbi:penicillin-binding protein 1A [Alcanivorax marinus]|uniref:Penicillin-binding protein 1A n=2 Tax=Alloalcanivorax marinus TaxID=1177169 RepID=A0A9Q3UJW6_9GAMM|nr:penicillin-binding protein 1A [Alloalcanivorax marinus]MCC4308322.1 penicillin-binding protein 1A [Alloalcanivorax marinus]